MATFKYPYAVKVNGMIVPPNTEVEVKDSDSAEKPADGTESTSEDVKKTTAKKRTKKA